MKILKKNITFFILLILSCLLYRIFLSGYFSGDTYDKFITLGYKGYALNYSFYDGRIIMGLICLVADALNIYISFFYITLLVMSIMVSTKTVLKIIEIIKDKKEPKGKLQYVFLVMIAYLYIFNFMTIDNMQFAECFVMALSIWFYTLCAENMVIKHNWKKGFLYCTMGIFCYQGTINMLFITIALLLLVEKNILERKRWKDLLIFAGVVVVSGLLNILFMKVVANYVNSVQSSRVSWEILTNIVSNLKKITYLLFNTIDLFPCGVYATFATITLFITYLYSIKKRQVKPFILTIFLLFICVISSLVLLCIYPDGIYSENGRIFGSIGASFSVIWLYLYTNTDILEIKDILQLLAIILVIIYFILNATNTLYITCLYKEGNKIDEQLAKQIEQEIDDYEKNGGSKIEYIAIKYINKTQLEEKQQYDERTLKKSMKFIGNFSDNILKAYTKVNPNIQKTYFEDEIMENYFNTEETIKCIGNTVYVVI